MRLAIPDRIPEASTLRSVHFVGIGGAGLSAIARIMAQRGIRVSGSDDHDTPFLPGLREVGATLYDSYAAEHVGDPDVVVVTTAAREDNPEVAQARRRGLVLWPRSAGLASVMAGSRVLAVAGTHGKTTTTSLLTVALQAAGADPTYAVGGVLSATGRNADAGTGNDFVAEADESDGAFLVYRPDVAIVTNVDADHLDVWGTVAAYRDGFAQFVGRITPGGLLVAVVDDEGAAALRAVASSLGVGFVAVGESESAEIRAVSISLSAAGSSFTVVDRGIELGRVQLRIPGRHYVADALAALAAGLRLGYPYAELVAGMEAFTGTQRRMEHKGSVAGVRLYDSYAHAPAELAGDLEAARALAGTGRVIAVFQPHLVSRTRLFGSAMGAALGAADEVLVTSVYLAREDADPEVTGAIVADAVPHGRAVYLPAWDDLVPAVLERARPGDVVLTLGAGTITELGPQILQALERVRG